MMVVYIFLEIDEFAPEIIVGDVRAANVVAKTDRNVVFPSGFGSGNDAVADDCSVDFVALIGHGVFIEQLHRDCGRDRTDELCIFFMEQGDQLVVEDG